MRGTFNNNSFKKGIIAYFNVPYHGLFILLFTGLWISRMYLNLIGEIPISLSHNFILLLFLAILLIKKPICWISGVVLSVIGTYYMFYVDLHALTPTIMNISYHIQLGVNMPGFLPVYISNLVYQFPIWFYPVFIIYFLSANTRGFYGVNFKI